MAVVQWREGSWLDGHPGGRGPRARERAGVLPFAPPRAVRLLPQERRAAAEPGDSFQVKLGGAVPQVNITQWINVWTAWG
jgi:hypothetical protein